MTLRKALLAATVLALPVAAHAQPVSGLYVGAGAGVNFRQNSDLTLTGPGASLFRSNGITSSPSERFKDPGFAGVASIGWGFGNGLRAEIEGNYRTNTLDRVRGTGISGRANAGGYADTFGVLVNALYDFNVGLPFTPYLGVGVGYEWANFRRVGYADGANGLRLQDSDGQFAYQGILGASYSLGSTLPGVSFTAEYRFLGTIDSNQNGVARVGAASGVTRAEASNYNHSILLGVRYAFNAPAPAPVVAAPAAAPAAPAIARTYLVFFDWDRADLTDRARQIITEAAGASRRVHSTRIEVAGHADRSGTPQYNQRLSERRAQAVAAELVRHGVDRKEIAITAFGESHPLVPTADGVREPQNRRVEIVLR